MEVKTIILFLFLSIPIFATGQTADSLVTAKQIDSLLRSLRPLIEQQKLEEALATVQLAEEKTIAAFGNTHPAYSICLAFRGKIAQRKEKYKEAESWYLAAMELQEKVYGKESPQIVISMSTLSSIYLQMGAYIKAEPLILKTLAIREKLVGKKHPDYARTLGTLGTLHFQKGFFGQAEVLYLEAMGIFEKTLGKKHPEYAVVLANLTNVYIETGNYAKAEPLMLEVNEINATAFGKQHPLYAKALINLATLYVQMGDISRAEPLLLEIKAMYNPGLSKESADYALVLGKLAAIYLDRGDTANAAPLVFESQEICAKIFGTKHMEYAWSLKNLGLFYVVKKEYTKAESYLLQAHEINTGTLERDHPNCALTAELLASLYQETKRFSESGERYLEAQQINRHIIEKAAGYSSEVEMAHNLQKYQQKTAQFYTFAAAHPSQAINEAAFDHVLFYKGFLLNATMQVKNRANANGNTAQALGFLRAYRHRLTEQYSLPLTDQDSVSIAELEDKANTLEKELARSVVGYNDALKQVGWKEVAKALKPGEAAIEFVHFQYYNTQGKPTDSTLYAALALRSGDDAPVMVCLAEEQELSVLMQGAAGGNYRKINHLYAAGAGKQKTLNDLTWKQLEPFLKDVKKVYCASTGLLHRLNMGAIPVNPSEVFADRRQLVVLGSIRQLVIPTPATTYTKEAFLVGGVNYAASNTTVDSDESVSSRSGFSLPENNTLRSDSLSRSDAWSYLPSTVTEVFNLRHLLASSGVSVQLDTGISATEESVKQIGGPDVPFAPRVLHFATHGYFFPEPKSGVNHSALAFKNSNNPLLRSGLILAGAQQAWNNGKPAPGREDGVLTAQEISLLNLTSAELVVLSACETGLGDIDDTEGVYGLQRAFKIAGAKYIVMSLWKVNDQTTSEFMTAFYTQWLQKGFSIPDAFRNAQRKMRAKYPAEAYHWAGFVLVE